MPKKAAKFERDLLARINAVEVPLSELRAIVEESAAYGQAHPEADPSFERNLVRILDHTDNDPDKAFAIMSRLTALATIIADGGAPGWTLPKSPDGGVWAQDAVLRAAAVHPLTVQGNEWSFERRSFLDRVLELAEPESSA